jgi:lipopolysaccharide cholinephosphotransferase
VTSNSESLSIEENKMGLKNRLTRFLPAYRAKDAIIDEFNALSNSVSALSRKIDDLNRKNDDLNRKNEYLFYCLQHLDGETELETKKRVFLNMPKADGAVRDFQIVANYILQRVKRICEKEGIQFFLDFGTLLGAVRHHGFIPWDDDVDLGIMRDDYYKLMDAVNSDPELEMHRYYRYTRPGVEAGYVTKIKLRYSELFFVDVFPFDLIQVAQDSIESAWHQSEMKCREYHELLHTIFLNNGFPSDCCIPTKNSSVDSEVEVLEKQFVFGFRPDVSMNAASVDVLWSGVDQLAWIRQMRKTIPDSFFLPFIPNGEIFEGERYPIPHRTDLYLRHVYGDYMSLPKVIQQTHQKELSVLDEMDRSIVETIKNSGKLG